MKLKLNSNAGYMKIASTNGKLLQNTKRGRVNLDTIFTNNITSGFDYTLNFSFH